MVDKNKTVVDKETCEAIAFAMERVLKYLEENSKDLDPEIAEIVDENLCDLLED